MTSGADGSPVFDSAAWESAAAGDPSLPASRMSRNEETAIEALLGISSP